MAARPGQRSSNASPGGKSSPKEAEVRPFRAYHEKRLWTWTIRKRPYAGYFSLRSDNMTSRGNAMGNRVPGGWIIGLDTEDTGALEKSVQDFVAGDPCAYSLPEEISSRIFGFLRTSPDLKEGICGLMEKGGPEPSVNTPAKRMVMAALPLGDQYGFTAGHLRNPAVSVCMTMEFPAERIFVVAVTRSYLERIMKKPCWLNILAQIAVRGLLIHEAVLHPLAAVLEESRLNSFSTIGSVMSDLSRDTLESCADRSEYELMEEMAAHRSVLEERIRELAAGGFLHGLTDEALELAHCLVKEAMVMSRLHQIIDYATGKPLMLRPRDIISVRHRAEISIAELPSLYLPPYLAGRVVESLTGIDHRGATPQVRVIRDIVAYRGYSDTAVETGFAGSVRHWVECYIEFCDRNIEGLKLLQGGIMNQADIDEERKIIVSMIDIRDRICAGSHPEYLHNLEGIIRDSADNETLSLALNRLINTIHQDVLQNVFGVFKGWKNAISDVNNVSSKAVCVTIDEDGGVEYYPANKVNIIDYSGDFRDGRSIPARSIIESYLSTNVHLRDNCYLDCISHTNKAWFYVDSGLHGANIFLDLDPMKPMITATYAEGDIEDGNMARMRVLADTLAELGFSVLKTEITLTARLDDRTSSTVDLNELIDKTVWTILAFASVADFDQEIEYCRITDRSLSFHRKRLSSSGTGFPLYLITRGSVMLYELDEVLSEINTRVLTLLDEELEHLCLEKIPEKKRNAKGIEMHFNRVVEKGISEGEFLSSARMPLYRNPGYSKPEPLAYLTGLLPDDCLKETARIVNILDKVAGSVSLAASPETTLTLTRLSLPGGPICIYALRDHVSYKPLKAFAADGSCLRKADLSDNVIRTPADILTLLERSGYHIETIEKRLQWARPTGTPIKGISIGAITSCPDMATGFLKKNRPTSTPDDFRSSIFFDIQLDPREMGRLKEASGYITTNDSPLSHAQLTARTLGKPGVILHEAQWVEDAAGERLVLHLGNRQLSVDEGTIATVDGSRGMIVFPGVSPDPDEDFRGSVKEAFALLNAIDEDSGTEELRELIVRTKNIEILKFIVQELFQSQHPIEILRCVMEAGEPGFIASLKEYIKDIVLESRRRQKNDIEVAFGRIAKAMDLVEAFFVYSRIEEQLLRTDGVEKLICPRIGLVPLDYGRETGNIRALFAAKRAEFASQAINRTEPLVKDPESLSDAALEGVLRIIDGAALPVQGDDLAGDRLARCREKMRLVAEGRTARLRESKDCCVMELKQTGRLTVPLTGNKASSLGELMRGFPGLSIPPGFVLTTQGIDEIIKRNKDRVLGLKAVLEARPFDKAACLRDIIPLASSLAFPGDIRSRVSSLYHGLERDAPAQAKIREVERLAGLCGIDGAVLSQVMGTIEDTGGRTIDEIIDLMPFPGEKALSLKQAYEEEGGLFVVVRSSSIHEDTRTDMMAGRYMSYTYVRGMRLLLDSIIKCLVYYWVDSGRLDNTQPVLIHSQVESDVAMVVNSINLSEHRWDEVVINASWGAGEGLVSSKVESDLYILDATNCTIKHTIPGTKTTRSVFNAEAGYGTRTVTIKNKAEQRRQTLSDKEAATMARLARRIHEFLHYPVDIEAIMYDGTISVVQVRPLVFAFFSPCLNHRLLTDRDHGQGAHHETLEGDIQEQGK
jgi:hypothetical protein